jgi:uncharacterized protein YkwD
VILVTAAILTVQSSSSSLSMLQSSYAQSCPDGSTPDASGNCATTSTPPPAGDGETQAPPAGDGQTAQAPPTTAETPPPATQAPPTNETDRQKYCRIFSAYDRSCESPEREQCVPFCNNLVQPPTSTTPYVVNKNTLGYLTGYQSALLFNPGGGCQSLPNTPQADSQNRTAQEDCSIGYVDGLEVTGSPTFQQTADFVRGMLDVHNRERAAVGVPPLVWSDTLAAGSKAWAEHVSQTNVLVHDYGNVEGENIAQGISNGPTLWVNEKNEIPQNYRGLPADQIYQSLSPNDQAATGHYLNMVWPTWKAVGCGTAANPYPIVVCRFSAEGVV